MWRTWREITWRRVHFLPFDHPSCHNQTKTLLSPFSRSLKVWSGSLQTRTLRTWQSTICGYDSKLVSPYLQKWTPRWVRGRSPPNLIKSYQQHEKGFNLNCGLTKLITNQADMKKGRQMNRLFFYFHLLYLPFLELYRLLSSCCTDMNCFRGGSSLT